MHKFAVNLIFLLSVPIAQPVRRPRPDSLRITNISCESLDRSSVVVTMCSLDKISNLKGAVNIRLELLEEFYNITVGIKLHRKYNKIYRHYLFNDVVNFCGLMDDSQSHILWKVLFETVLSHSNMNHSCPFNHEIVLTNFTMDSNHLKFIPLPSGEYKNTLQFSVNSTSKIQIDVFIVR